MAKAQSEVAIASQPLTIRILTSAALYFLFVFGVGFVLGPIRVFWLEPVIGPVAAALCEAPLLLAAMMFAALRVPAKIGMPINTWSLIKMGLMALGILILADVTVGTAIRGISWGEQFAYLATPAGLMYLGLLAAFAAMPALLNTNTAA